ncbi:hypothetical protein LINGRAHAP2_LOCUS3250 [Linum grandiflorum]
MENNTSLKLVFLVVLLIAVSGIPSAITTADAMTMPKECSTVDDCPKKCFIRKKKCENGMCVCSF